MFIAALDGYRLKKSGDDTGRELLCRVIANANMTYGNLVLCLISHGDLTALRKAHTRDHAPTTLPPYIQADQWFPS